MRIGELLWLPVKVLWAAIKACAIPAVVTAAAWWLLPDARAKWITIGMVLWAVIVLALIAAKLNGHVRSLGRGPFYLRTLDDEWL